MLTPQVCSEATWGKVTPHTSAGITASSFIHLYLYFGECFSSLRARKVVELFFPYSPSSQEVSRPFVLSLGTPLPLGCGCAFSSFKTALSGFCFLWAALYFFCFLYPYSWTLTCEMEHVLILASGMLHMSVFTQNPSWASSPLDSRGSPNQSQPLPQAADSALGSGVPLDFGQVVLYSFISSLMLFR